MVDWNGVTPPPRYSGRETKAKIDPAFTYHPDTSQPDSNSWLFNTLITPVRKLIGNGTPEQLEGANKYVQQSITPLLSDNILVWSTSVIIHWWPNAIKPCTIPETQLTMPQSVGSCRESNVDSDVTFYRSETKEQTELLATMTPLSRKPYWMSASKRKKQEKNKIKQSLSVSQSIAVSQLKVLDRLEISLQDMSLLTPAQQLAQANQSSSTMQNAAQVLMGMEALVTSSMLPDIAPTPIDAQLISKEQNIWARNKGK